MLVDGVVVFASAVETYYIIYIYMIVYLSISTYSVLQYMLVLARNLTKCGNKGKLWKASSLVMGQ